MSDGQQLYIPTIWEANAQRTAFSPLPEDPAFSAGSFPQVPDHSAAPDAAVNINTADTALLMTLPGIGETRARAIIEYRESCGSFTCIEDLMKVSGIGKAIFEKLKEKVTV